MSKNVIRVLQERGFIDAMTSDQLEKMAETPLKFIVVLTRQPIAFI